MCLATTAGAYTLSTHLDNRAKNGARVAVTPTPRISVPQALTQMSRPRLPVTNTPTTTALRVAFKAVTVSPPTTRAPAPPPPPSTTVAAPTPPPDSCAASIAAVEARGLYPAPGFAVICPGNALGHEGMTCMNEPGLCPAVSEIIISVPEPDVVANEFENSRIFAGAPARCETVDCGGSAYGY
jgi:hypothetical protein